MDVEILIDSLSELSEVAGTLSECLSILRCQDEFSTFVTASSRAYDAVDNVPAVQEAIRRAG